MEKYLEVKLIENTEDEKVTAEVKLIKQPDADYDHAVLYIMGDPKGVFDDTGVMKFQPSQFGKIECEVIFYKGESSVWEIEDELEINISTWFVGAHPDLGHVLQKIDNGGKLELFSRPRARGNNDICFRMVVRVPAGESLSFGNVVQLQDDPRPKHNQVLKIHYRLADYKNRNDLYIPPDEAMFHIDKESEKWLENLTLEHGIHVVYVVPSCAHDLSYLIINGHSKIKILDSDLPEETNHIQFSVSGFFKTIL